MLSPSYISILGVKVHNYSLKEILENVRSELKSSTFEHKNKQLRAGHVTRVLPIYTVNPEFLVLAYELNTFKKILNRAFVAVPDGIGILYAGLLKRRGFQERITGIDLVHSLTRLAAEHDLQVGYLGGKQNAAEKTLNRFKKQYTHLKGWSDPGPKISFTRYSFSDGGLNSQKTLTDLIKIHQNSHDLESLLEKISQTDILFVAFGAPKQEFFIEHMKGTLTTNLKSKILNQKSIVAVGVGGSLDEISGISPQSPHWIERAGFKWLFRLVTEPWRWKRQLRLIKFIYLLMRDSHLS
ncbi:MAG: teichoic acid biosynthesis protein, N-acetylglucosaminyldiphosphoundecaprenol [Microgenomates group bacterium GW2011_GWC1_41_8]|uniref:Glycosyl transferase, wecB/tagA/cpsF family n=3 Tax=Candidatus Roizmaniibacteriota TaxID=1752723 RepID=A0A0G0XDY9_9BACT|nr:MAG: Glycosyl transferase, wecB/tagA/cpsF family [Candidatus Roizmanbacteria bacterium GW2011_GWB1_40_7]KKR91160.1 MAG: Glycosyl transferase, wecB/tagA/cpsF family [Candidatus Roizmanbacteria bacterium GW2011_GWA1_41_13]KKS22607.1 MAG: Glycosyl transferase, wecB/tagA/cpsF family [Candidatus Roizmanbacteria bacterium GW2011_GWC2_41_7]KKS23132.1 MAG: teichoic acid biosynthesis protein, N-acetylglucosaminyldiphosphoundecaprenol [Microgenomates group bacterium GW2011_GWC1_41_8]OGK49337.1 MAG: hy